MHCPQSGTSLVKVIQWFKDTPEQLCSKTALHTLQVKTARGEWITAAPVPGTFVCNVGDMLRVYSNGEAFPPAHAHL